MTNKERVILEFLTFGLGAATILHRPETELNPNLDPTFYHTGSYEGDRALQEKVKLYKKVVEKYIEELYE